MGEFRASLQQGRPADEIATRIQVLDGLFDDAEAALSPDAASTASTFLGAFTILLREGLEALLIVVAMIAFLRKAERPEVLRYVHGGWIGALAARSEEHKSELQSLMRSSYAVFCLKK